MNKRALILAPFPRPCHKLAVSLPTDVLTDWLEPATIMSAPGSPATCTPLTGWGSQMLARGLGHVLPRLAETGRGEGESRLSLERSPALDPRLGPDTSLPPGFPGPGFRGS